MYMCMYIYIYIYIYKSDVTCTLQAKGSRYFLPANAKAISTGDAGMSCAEGCAQEGLGCLPEDLAFINNCPALQNVFGCEVCQPSEGAEQPAQDADPMDPDYQKCLFNTNVRRRPAGRLLPSNAVGCLPACLPACLPGWLCIPEPPQVTNGGFLAAEKCGSVR